MPWSLGNEVHVDNLHAENVHVDGNPISLSTLTSGLTGVAHGLGVGTMHFDPFTNAVTYSTTAGISATLADLQTRVAALEGAEAHLAPLPDAVDAVPFTLIITHQHDSHIDDITIHPSSKRYHQIRARWRT